MQLTAFDSPVDGSWRYVESGGRAISKEELMETWADQIGRQPDRDNVDPA